MLKYNYNYNLSEKIFRSIFSERGIISTCTAVAPSVMGHVRITWKPKTMGARGHKANKERSEAQPEVSKRGDEKIKRMKLKVKEKAYKEKQTGGGLG